jgi:branched-chain amino acid transport system ATP-binding protein
MSELIVSGLTTGYHYPVPALVDVNLKVRSAQVVALVGPNGAGKSTTLGAISGLLRPWSGQITLDGQRIDGKSTFAIVKGGIAQVPEGRGILPGLTVAENLAMGGYTMDRTRFKNAMRRAYELFPRLAELSKRSGGTLSGGEQQMLAIARALMSEPRILLLDEPSMGLAPLLVERIFEHVESLREGGLGILLVEQNVQLAFQVSDYAYILERGHIVLEGPSPVCAADLRVQQSYLGV